MRMPKAEYLRGEAPLLRKWWSLLPALVALGQQPHDEQSTIVARRLAHEPVFVELIAAWPEEIERGERIRAIIKSGLEALSQDIPKPLPKGIFGYEFVLCWHLHINHGLSVSAVGQRMTEGLYPKDAWGDPQMTVRQRMWRSGVAPTYHGWPGVVCLIEKLEALFQVELATTATDVGVAPPSTVRDVELQRIHDQVSVFLRIKYADKLHVDIHDVPDEIVDQGFDPLVGLAIVKAERRMDREDELKALSFAYRAYRVHFPAAPVPTPLADEDEFADLAYEYGTTQDYAATLAPFFPVATDDPDSRERILSEVGRLIEEALWKEFEVWWYKVLQANDPDLFVPRHIRDHRDWWE